MPLFPLIVARERGARGERSREPEPMVMDDPGAAQEYDAAGAATQVPVHDFVARAMSQMLPPNGTAIDLGCGSGRLLARLAQGRPDVRLIGLDLSEPMLELGRDLLAAAGLGDRVELRLADITTFDADLPGGVDLVSCNFALHQLPTEDIAGRCLQAISRARQRSGCAVWIFDLARLRHPRSWPDLVKMIEMPGPVFEADTLASERAAYSPQELGALIGRAGLSDLISMRARPLGEYQVWRTAPSEDLLPPPAWRPVVLPAGTRVATQIVARSFPRSLTAG